MICFIFNVGKYEQDNIYTDYGSSIYFCRISSKKTGEYKNDNKHNQQCLQ